MVRNKKFKLQEAKLLENEASIYYSKNNKKSKKINSYYNDLIYKEI